MTLRPETSTVDIAATPASAWALILELARLAPTPHNTQWYFIRVLDGQSANVCIDETISIPFTDPNDQFRYLGLGVFARHLELAARAAGFEVQTTFDELNQTRPVAARIVGRRAPDDALSEQLHTRRTSRLAYGSVPVSDRAISAVQAIGDKRTSVTMTTDPQIVRTVLELNNELLLADLEDEGTSRELDHWIRYTKRSRQRFRSGFTPASLATPVWKIWLVFRLRTLLRFGVVRRWLTNQYLAQNRAATVGWIYGPLATRRDQYEAGRTLMDAWITLTEHGYYLQPYGSIITDDAARGRLLRVIGIDEAPGDLVWMVFRAGTSSPPPQSLRKPIEEYLR
jgi:hypothetical protein